MITPPMIQLLEEFQRPPNGGNGMCYHCRFERQGNVSPGTAFRIGEVSSVNGIPLIGRNMIVKITVATANILGTATTFQIQRRISSTEFADIPGAAVTIDIAAFYGKVENLAIDLQPDDTIRAICSAGVAVSSPILVVWLMPK